VGTLVALLGVHPAAQSQLEGHLIMAFDTSIAAAYFDPAPARPSAGGHPAQGRVWDSEFSEKEKRRCRSDIS
jgi:hypothetical protein